MIRRSRTGLRSCQPLAAALDQLRDLQDRIEVALLRPIQSFPDSLDPFTGTVETPQKLTSVSYPSTVSLSNHWELSWDADDGHSPRVHQ